MVLRLRLILEFPVMRFRCREGFEVPEVIFRIPDHIWRRHLHRTSFTPLGGGGGARHGGSAETSQLSSRVEEDPLGDSLWPKVKTFERQIFQATAASR